jgi:carboxyl-terminal processing protease
MKIISIAFLTWLLSLCSTPAFSQDWNKGFTPQQKIYTLSKMWKDVSENFAFFENVPNLNWDSLYQNYIPKVLATKTKFEYYRLLERFICSLKDGHTVMYHFNELFPHYMRFNFNNNLRLYTEGINKKVYITRVGSEEMTKTIPLGTEIIEVNSMPVRKYLEEEVFPYIAASTEQALWFFGVPEMFRGLVDVEKPYQWNVKFKKPDGNVFSMMLTLTKEPLDYEGKSYPKFPDFNKDINFKWLQNGVAYLALNTFAIDTAVIIFKSLIPELKRAKSIILDLRFNRGGNTNIGVEILSYFTDADTLIGSKQITRVSNAYYKAKGYNLRNKKVLDEEEKMYLNYYKNDSWTEGDTMKFQNVSPYKDRLRMPLAVLTGTYTVSAGEDFLIMQDGLKKRAVTIGQKTSGSTGQRLGVKIPTGGSYFICTKKDTYPDGRKFVGIGIIPDIEIEPTIEDVLEGNDVILNKALEVLLKKIKN